MQYHLVPLGCQMNQSDAERIRTVLESIGYTETDREDQADILGIVACSVRQKAIDKVYSKIHTWNTWKNHANLLTFVSGCMLPEDREKFLTRFDLVFTINELPELPDMIAQYGVVTPAGLGAGPGAHSSRAGDARLDAASAGIRAAERLSTGRSEQPSPTVTSDADSPEAGDLPDAPTERARPPQGAAPAASTEIADVTGGPAGRDRPPRGAAAAASIEIADVTGGPATKTSTDETERALDSAPLPEALTMRDAGRRRPTEQRRTLYTPTIPAGPHGVEQDIREGFWHVKPTYTSSFEAYVPIQNGCDKFCTFCAVPYTRGREVSRPSEEILAEVEELVAHGYRAITLLGQNVNSYGLDRRSSEMSFSQLLDHIGRITRGHDVWVYFTSPHPRDMTDDVLKTIATYSSLANQIHLPIQSGDDKILIRMNRNYRVSGYRRVVESIRDILPDATLFTDIIVGFSGETREQFERTREAMREFRYNMAYIAAYSPRPGAASARWKDDIDQAEKKRRLHELSEVLQETSGAYNRSLVGSRMSVLIDGHDRKPGYLSAKTEGKIPVRIPDLGTEVVGSFQEIEVTEARALSIFGELVPGRESCDGRRTAATSGAWRAAGGAQTRKRYLQSC